MKLQFYIFAILVASFILLTKQEVSSEEKNDTNIKELSSLLPLIEAIINDPEFLEFPKRMQINILLRIYEILSNFQKSNSENEKHHENEQEWHKVKHVISQ